MQVTIISMESRNVDDVGKSKQIIGKLLRLYI